MVWAKEKGWLPYDAVCTRLAEVHEGGSYAADEAS
jgi:hypothetical protein